VIVRLHGVDINVEVHTGNVDSPTLVLIHGFGASLRTWDRLMPSLQSHSWIGVDLKGFGLSGHPRDDTYSIDDNAELVADLLARECRAPVVLIGHSYGGAVALLLVEKLRARTGPRVEGLVLIDAASYQQRLPFFIDALRYRVTRWLSEITPAERRSKVVLRSLFVDKSQVDAEMIERYAFPLRIEGSNYATAQTALQILPESFDDVTRKIQAIDVPTQIIWGSRDPAVPPAFAARLHRDIRGSRLEVLPNVGHLPHEECPAEVVRIIHAFLQELR
jgi:pimeloyl-ACP methyl ester carboxylesterase